MSATARGVAIDEAEPPAWVAAHVSPFQLKLDRGLLWAVLVYKYRGMHESRYNVAQRLYIHTIGKEHKRANPSIRSLMADLEIHSENTAIGAIKDLEQRGLLIVIRHGNGRNLYILAWPLHDTTSPEGPARARCGHPTKKSGTCTRPAGWGTTHPGDGPCKRHGGQPRNPGPAPQPLQYGEDSNTPFTPQPLRDETGSEPRSHTSTIEASYLNHCGVIPQPLRRHTSTIEVEYEWSTSRSTKRSTKQPGLLAVGEPYVRNAREPRTAPSAQPITSITARSAIAAIGRYRDAPGWARKYHLIPMADAALTAGFGQEAILRYAHMVITEARFAEHQHIPEFREALRRLAHDAARGDACQTHGRPECPTCTTDTTQDRPWTEQDQADLNATLDYLGITKTSGGGPVL